MTPREEQPWDFADDRHVIHNHYHGGNSGNSDDTGGFAKLIAAILPLAVVALVGVVWNLSINVAKMEVNLSGLTLQIDKMRRDLP